ncbi:aryl-sulfate sulfotransferase [Tuberibacillus sp. Marseille-P3662]|uniref:aryl-sulfate sulfotransferase n=1 Tax=Tuberibacillus sp. Marseille-P3662 TaxID=1965358 RepID=UPI000A1CC2B0|nr:aryl-sulfate sulfotransferase [Tuberibacillus sp. Marseille-P3662]
MKRNIMIYGVIVAVILIGLFAFNTEQTIGQPEPNVEAKDVHFDQKSKSDVKQISTSDVSRINQQKQMEQKLLTSYHKKAHSFKNPFITLDPYDAAPLTALVMFQTDEPMKVSLTVEGKDNNSDITKTFTKYKTEHQLPVLGLYPDYKNTVTVEATNQDGETQTTQLHIQTEPLPDDFLTTDLIKADTEKMEKGLTFITTSSRYAYAVDDHADVRWYSTLWNSHIFRRLDNGHLLYITKEEGQDKYNELLEMDMLGKVSRSYLIHLGDYDSTDILHHDVVELPNGNLLATTHDTDSAYIEDKMVEIDRQTGETVRSFDFRDILPESFYEDYNGEGADEGDWFHQNAIWFDETDHSILVSSRNQDLVMKLSYPKGEIQWILSSPEKWPDAYKPYLLESKGHLKYPGGQHAVKTLPDQDNNDDTTDIILFDNNNVITRGNDFLSGNYSRAVQYRINEKENTVKEVWSYGENRGEEFFSTIVGDADVLAETGNRLITSGYIDVDNGMNSRIVETNDQDPAKVIYELIISGFESGSHRQAYRAHRLSLYPEQKWHFELGQKE